jgi:magnesium chelatase accessory protein
MQSRILDVAIPDGNLRVEFRGSGPALLCLHGISANRHIWSPVADALEDRFRLLLVDLLSRGGSQPRPDLSYRLADEVRRLRALLAELEVSPELVMGHSQGAALALALASVDVRVRGLVLLNPVTPWTRRPHVLRLLRPGLMRQAVAGIIRPLRRPLAHVILRRVYGPGTTVTAERVAAYSEPYADPRRATALFCLLADWEPGELEHWLPTRTVDTCVLTGAMDPRIEPENARRLADLLGGQFTLVPDGGHALPEEMPQRVVEQIERVHGELERKESAD